MSKFRLDTLFILLVWVLWAGAMFLGNRWGLFVENWFMSVTMAFGSFVAGSTSQGGGAVAFPVMTLGFNIDPKSARDFSMMIQSVGMTSASVAILCRRIPVDRKALLFGGLAGAGGVIVGLEVVQYWFDSDPTKVFFVSLWLAFGFALWRISHLKRPVRLLSVGKHGGMEIPVLVLAGFAGGIITGLLGSGLDILIFAVLVLGFRVCETVATPTSVVLMAGNSLVGFVWRQFGGGEPIAEDTWNYWWVCVPVVAIGAPAGARFISNRGHEFIVRLLLVVILLQFVGALVIVKFTGFLTILAVSTFLLGVALFWAIWRWGQRYA
ncbi:MAG: hypothetical protein CMO55_11785 [Verrucomicrobiales bacterium]|nr:hypothetical protein [Verrucomicrobiales bacterium]